MTEHYEEIPLTIVVYEDGEKEWSGFLAVNPRITATGTSKSEVLSNIQREIKRVLRDYKK